DRAMNGDSPGIPGATRIAVGLRLRPPQVQLRHSILERAWFQSEKFGGAAFPSNAPSGSLEHRTYVLAFDVVEARRGSCSRELRLRNVNRQPGTRGYDHG